MLLDLIQSGRIRWAADSDEGSRSGGGKGKSAEHLKPRFFSESLSIGGVGNLLAHCVTASQDTANGRCRCFHCDRIRDVSDAHPGEVVDADWEWILGKPGECTGAQRVALINQGIAERYFPNENPVGKRIAYSTKPKPDSWMTIVGVVGNVRDAGVYRPGLNVLYAPFGQFDGAWKTVSLVLRTTVEPETLSQAVRRACRVDPLAALRHE